MSNDLSGTLSTVVPPEVAEELSAAVHVINGGGIEGSILSIPDNTSAEAVNALVSDPENDNKLLVVYPA